jgi:membrane-bound lytic murein transglycosylase D
MTFRDRIVIGKQLQLDFNKVSRANFKLRRLDFHSNLQRNFFETYQIKGSEEYEIKLSDNINRLAKNRYSAPLWLVRQYNPGINFNSIYAGQRVTFPLLKAIKSPTLN